MVVVMSVHTFECVFEVDTWSSSLVMYTTMMVHVVDKAWFVWWRCDLWSVDLIAPTWCRDYMAGVSWIMLDDWPCTLPLLGVVGGFGVCWQVIVIVYCACLLLLILCWGSAGHPLQQALDGKYIWYISGIILDWHPWNAVDAPCGMILKWSQGELSSADLSWYKHHIRSYPVTFLHSEGTLQVNTVHVGFLTQLSVCGLFVSKCLFVSCLTGQQVWCFAVWCWFDAWLCCGRWWYSPTLITMSDFHPQDQHMCMSSLMLVNILNVLLAHVLFFAFAVLCLLVQCISYLISYSLAVCQVHQTASDL